MFKNARYKLSFKLLNASDFDVPQDRKRVFFVGIRQDFDFEFQFPEPLHEKVTLEQKIAGLQNSVVPAKEGNKTNKENCRVPNHEYMIGGFSSMFMSRNIKQVEDTHQSIHKHQK